MGMTIDEAALYMELYKRKLFDSVSDLDKDIEAYDIAINTMRKYQKIAEIVTNNELEWGNASVRANAFLEVKKVVEDGNN